MYIYQDKTVLKRSALMLHLLCKIIPQGLVSFDAIYDIVYEVCNCTWINTTRCLVTQSLHCLQNLKVGI